MERSVFMFILIGILVSFAVSAAQLWLFSPDKSVRRRVTVMLNNGVGVTVLSLAVQKYAFGYEHFLKTSMYGFPDFLLFFVTAVLVGAAVLFCYGVTNHYILFESAGPGRKKKYASKITGSVLVFLGCMCVFATNWSKGEYGDLPIDQVLITYLSPTVGSDMVDYTAVLEGPVFLSLLISALYGMFAFSSFSLVYHSPKRVITIFNHLAHRILCIVLAALVFLGGLTYGLVRYRAASIFRSFCMTSNIIDDNYVDPREANLQFPEQKRNLIHIFLESMENSYMDQENGGFMEENLIPELTEIAREGYSFSHLDHQFGGPRSAVGTTWSVASMVNMSTGLPMKIPEKFDAYDTRGSFLPGACALGDLLKEQGYEQTLMFGADSDFGGLTDYFGSHGDFKIMDYKYARDHGMIPEDYFVWWGFEDDKLFEFAKQELTRMSETGKPFHFVMETADTHRPEGYVSQNTPCPYPNQYANVLAYSSSEVSKFIRWIQAQPFYDNTTIVITGDHLSMESIFFEYYDFTKDFRRSQYTVILNPDPAAARSDHDILFNRDYANFDFFPTSLSSMGVTYDGHRLGIGTDLFSGEKTLFEEYGFRKVNRELEKKSDLYNEQILK